MTVEMRMESVTPEKATEWLKKNNSNRPLSRRNVERFAEAMKRGEWKLNGEAIQFDTNGKLINGQHRLNAVVVSGIKIQSYIARGLEPEDYYTIDQGKARSIGDVFAVAGEKSYTILASTCRLSYIIDFGNEKSIQSTAKLMTDYLEANPGLRDSVATVRGFSNVDFRYPPSPFAAMHYQCSRKSKKAADEFFKLLCIGEGLTRFHPANRIRVLITEIQSKRTAAIKADDLCLLLAKCWNAWRSDQEVRLLKMGKNEEIPTLK